MSPSLVYHTNGMNIYAVVKATGISRNKTQELICEFKVYGTVKIDLQSNSGAKLVFSEANRSAKT